MIEDSTANLLNLKLLHGKSYVVMLSAKETILQLVPFSPWSLA